MSTAEPAPEPLTSPRPALRAQSAQPLKRRAAAFVDYPDSDGKPMAETPIHWHATVDVAQPLMERYADRADAYVGSDMLMYWVEGNTGEAVSPDVFVAFGPGREPYRAVWKVWEEGKAADFVLEVTSRCTRGKDEGYKAGLYEGLGVAEYWLFDPTEDYLRPNLKGRRLGPDGTYEPIPLEERDGGLWGWSEALGLELRPEGETLRLYDPALGELLLTSRDMSRIIKENDRIIAIRAETIAHMEARLAAEARIAELERQLAEVGK